MPEGYVSRFRAVIVQGLSFSLSHSLTWQSRAGQSRIKSQVSGGFEQPNSESRVHLGSLVVASLSRRDDQELFAAAVISLMLYIQAKMQRNRG